MGPCVFGQTLNHLTNQARCMKTNNKCHLANKSTVPPQAVQWWSMDQSRNLTNAELGSKIWHFDQVLEDGNCTCAPSLLAWQVSSNLKREPECTLTEEKLHVLLLSQACHELPSLQLCRPPPAAGHWLSPGRNKGTLRLSSPKTTRWSGDHSVHQECVHPSLRHT